MKVVILAGGLGTRLAEETEIRPKPMVEVGGSPILWHIMKTYEHFGLREFVVALGYKGHLIKQYFQTYHSLAGSMTIDLLTGATSRHREDAEDWRIHLIETGQNTNTGGRVRRLRSLVSGLTFMATYGDGVADVDIGALLAFHRSQGKIATVTAVRPPARYGALEFADENPDLISSFSEKPQTGEGWINGGYFVFEPQIFDYLESDADSLETTALTRLAGEGQLAAYRHDGFWQCMDTVRDKMRLEQLWQSERPPWKVWT